MWALRGSGRVGSPRLRARWISAVEVGSLRGSGWLEFAVVAVYCRCIVSVCFDSHRGADGNQLSQGTFVIAVVTAVVAISRCSEPLPFH